MGARLSPPLSVSTSDVADSSLLSCEPRNKAMNILHLRDINPGSAVVITNALTRNWSYVGGLCACPCTIEIIYLVSTLGVIQIVKHKCTYHAVPLLTWDERLGAKFRYLYVVSFWN